MSVESRVTNGRKVWRVRWREGGRNRARTFDLKRDADLFDQERRRADRLGTLAQFHGGMETLDEYVATVWVPTHAALLAPKTRRHYGSLYEHHIGPYLGGTRLRDLTGERIGEWQSKRRVAGAGLSALRQAMELLSSILQLAMESGRVPTNATRMVRKVRPPRPKEVVPLAPRSVERLREAVLAGGSAQPHRDATLISVLAYSGLRPGEALALTWGKIREKTILVDAAVSLGELKDTKTGASRTVRLLGPLRADLAGWRLACGSPGPDVLVFPAASGGAWTEPAYQSWRRRVYGRARVAAGVPDARVYDLRHSFASLLLHEGQNVLHIARQLGHNATLTLSRYGHVIDELEGTPSVEPEDLIRAARAAIAKTRAAA